MIIARSAVMSFPVYLITFGEDLWADPSMVRPPEHGTDDNCQTHVDLLLLNVPTRCSSIQQCVA